MDRELNTTLIAIRRKIHQHPELSGHEKETALLVEKALGAAGIVTRRIYKTGVIATIKGAAKKSSRRTACIALRADMDALPIVEKTGKGYASVNRGVMHACGHDANTTMLIGAALLLARQRATYAGTVKCIFQPSEETGSGARALIRRGVLKNPDVDAIIGMHVSPWLSPGTLGLKYGEMMAAVDRFVIEIIGTGGHGAYPHLGTDAITTASHVILALQTLVSREINPVEPIVITIGTVEGGQRFNVLCDRVRMEGTVRTLNKKLHAQVPSLIEHKIRQITRAFKARYTLSYEVLESPLVNAKEVLHLCGAVGASLLGAGRIKAIEKPSMGGEDFSEYLKFVPGCFLYFGTAKKVFYPWHHEKFDIDEKVLATGAQYLSEVAKEYLRKT